LIVIKKKKRVPLNLRLDSNKEEEEGIGFIDNPLVRIYFTILMIGWTGLAP
jgi:hypothetical protein